MWANVLPTVCPRRCAGTSAAGGVTSAGQTEYATAHKAVPRTGRATSPGQANPEPTAPQAHPPRANPNAIPLTVVGMRHPKGVLTMNQIERLVTQAKAVWHEADAEGREATPAERAKVEGLLKRVDQLRDQEEVTRRIKQLGLGRHDSVTATDPNAYGAYGGGWAALAKSLDVRAGKTKADVPLAGLLRPNPLLRAKAVTGADEALGYDVLRAPLAPLGATAASCTRCSTGRALPRRTSPCPSSSRPARAPCPAPSNATRSAPRRRPTWASRFST